MTNDDLKDVRLIIMQEVVLAGGDPERNITDRIVRATDRIEAVVLRAAEGEQR